MPQTQIITIRQARRARFHRLQAAEPALIRVRRGRKVVLGAGDPVEVPEGHFCLMPDATALTVENHPAPDGKGYEAEALILPRRVIEAAHARLADTPGPAAGEGLRALDLPEAALRLFAAFAPGGEAARWPEEIRALRLEELALWALAAGASLPRAAPERLADRVRRMIGAAPGEDWTAPRAAAQLAMSEATLRRRLAAEGASFADLLREERLLLGLALLQTTALPVGRVALEAGYASASQFAARFRSRFGLLPREIRADPAEIDRSAA